MDQGTLKNGNIVAVKKLVMGTSTAKADFATEVRLISNVHHRNILRLLGCSSKGPDLLLVYDYMANGSLDKFLYGKLSISSTRTQVITYLLSMYLGQYGKQFWIVFKCTIWHMASSKC